MKNISVRRSRLFGGVWLGRFYASKIIMLLYFFMQFNLSQKNILKNQKSADMRVTSKDAWDIFTILITRSEKWLFKSILILMR